MGFAQFEQTSKPNNASVCVLLIWVEFQTKQCPHMPVYIYSLYMSVKWTSLSKVTHILEVSM